MANLSTRGNIGTGDNILIAGVVIQGSGTKRVLVTGRGASVPVAGNIANTQLRVVNQATKDTIATSDDYASEDQNAAIRAAGKAPTIADNDAAVILDLPAGAYTVLVSGQVEPQESALSRSLTSSQNPQRGLSTSRPEVGWVLVTTS